MILSSPETSKPWATNIPLSDTAVPFLSDTVTSETQIPNSIHVSTIDTVKPSPLPVTTVSPAETSPAPPSATNGNDDNGHKVEDNTDDNDDDHDDNDGPTIVPIPIPIRPPKPGDDKGGHKPNDSNPTKEPPKSTKEIETALSCAISISMTWESVMCTVTAAVTTGKPACTTQAFTTVVSCSGTTPGNCSGGLCGLAKRGLIKRATEPPKCKWPGPENYADPENFIATEGSLAKADTDDAKGLHVVSLPDSGSTSSKRILFGDKPIYLSVPHLMGYEVPIRATAEDHEYGLDELRRAGRIFDDESDPHIFFFLPYKIIEEVDEDQYNEENPVGLPPMWNRDGAPSPRADEDGPTFNDQLRSEIAGIFPDIPIETVMYAADLESDPEDIDANAMHKTLMTFHLWSADPSAHVFEGKLWVYPSHGIEANVVNGTGGAQYTMRDYHTYSMKSIYGRDPVIDHGVALSVDDNGKYYLYFPAKDKDEIFRIGVAVSNKPSGPFKADKSWIPGTYSIDPANFVDTDGEAFLIWGESWIGDKAAPNGTNALSPQIAKLSKDMHKITETPCDLVILAPETGKPLQAEDNNRRFFEGPWVHKRGKLYYLMYSTGDTHFLVYATSKNIYGPYTYQGKILDPVDGWTTHGSIVEYKGQ
ncbi:alpha-N-arabinofuranosidase alpha-L-arabinofuranosidase [Fusarium agapanthi]|uniref:Alpha-N-arabinofuranosidase alpha-L-arabinofuranosidase n=1 Tax=Fusarium agapanthi TaxID=1803897 RepID=A0A9P5BB16_9HYPO|nr:alpha-N-arabinofuranosidase alpha-L-arabinofuranosidase [Fusarium agapanthi]